MTNLDWWKFHKGIVDTPRPQPKSYSLVHGNGVVVIAEKSYAYCVAMKKKHNLAVIKPNF